MNDVQNYLQPAELNVFECAQKISVLQIVFKEKREESKSLCEELGISSEPPKRIRKRYIFGDGSTDACLLHEDDVKRKMF